MIIRREQPGDIASVRAVHCAAFATGDAEPAEARLLDELRACDGWIPALSWVAELDDQIVGHSTCTRGYVSDVPCLGLGPIGVLPDKQRCGVGSALMRSMIGAADALGEPLVALLGDPAYYSRFGFRTSTEFGIDAPEQAWGIHFQVLRLTSWSDTINGSFQYSSPFSSVV